MKINAPVSEKLIRKSNNLSPQKNLIKIGSIKVGNKAIRNCSLLMTCSREERIRINPSTHVSSPMPRPSAMPAALRFTADMMRMEIMVTKKEKIVTLVYCISAFRKSARVAKLSTMQ